MEAVKTLILSNREINNGYRCLLVIMLMFFFASCEENKNKVGAEYKGPVTIVEGVEVNYSEQGIQKVQVITPRSLKYLNNNEVFPDTININFFDPSGQITTRLRADSGRFDHNANIFIVKGDVRVVKSETQEILTTTELSWNSGTRKVFTDKPLTVRNNRTSEITHAIGMDAEQDFTRIKFRKATGIYKFKNADFSSTSTPDTPPGIY